MKIIDQFISNWANKNNLNPVSLAELHALESKLNIKFPQSYLYLITTYGLPHTPNVFTKVCDLNSPITDVQDFLHLEDVYSLSRLYEMTGMPAGHVLFASDSQGNMFCFKTRDCHLDNHDAPIWFYNQNLREITKASDSFIHWIKEFNSLED